MSLFSRRRSIIEIMDQHRRNVLKGEVQSVRAMIRAYEPVERYLRTKLKSIEQMIAVAQAGGKDPGSLLFEQARYRILIEELTAKIDEFSKKAEGQTKDSQERSARLGTAQAGELIKAEVKAKRAFATLNNAAIESMVGAFADGSPLRDLFGEFSSKAISAAQGILVSGIAAGDSPRQTARRLMTEIEELTRNRAMTISRNESLRVLTTAQQRTYEANSDVVLGSRIVSALDARTCPLCWARHGTILKHGEGFHRHIACRCSLAPVTIDTPRRITGQEAFDKLSEEEQLQILGKARYELYRNGQIQLSDLYKLSNDPKWGPQIKLRPIQSVTKRAPGTFTRGVASPGKRRSEFAKPYEEGSKTNIEKFAKHIVRKDKEILAAFNPQTGKREWALIGQRKTVIPPPGTSFVGLDTIHQHPSSSPISAEDIETFNSSAMNSMRIVSRAFDVRISNGPDQTIRQVAVVWISESVIELLQNPRLSTEAKLAILKKQIDYLRSVGYTVEEL